MSALTASEIARRSGGEVRGDPEARVTTWAFDSRALDAGACFVALRDSRDGHDFVRDAFDAGARVAVVDHPVAGLGDLGIDRALVVVGDTLAALQTVARSLRAERADARVVAVAGSTGKTSTKDLLASVLAPLGCHANLASYNNEFGLPITLCNTPATARVIVTEMGERVVGDLALLCDIARPEIGVITNVGLAHAEHLGGVEGTITVLAELLAALPAQGTAVLNADDPSTPALAGRAAAAVLTVGMDAGADVRFGALELDERLRASFELEGHRLFVPLHGAHHAGNAAMAAVVAHHLFGLSYDEITVGLQEVERGRWRMELLETDDGITILNDAYNANPTSMRAALDALAHLTVKGRRLAVLGEMRELGAHHDDEHATIGAHARALGIDIIVGVGAGGAAIADAAEPDVESHRVDDAKAASELAVELAVPGDLILVKGSRALGLERVASALLAREGERA
jgi:UDP-N-acetylmuramoyl-tripeptide--D-alanyl-D-alanine ligase